MMALTLDDMLRDRTYWHIVRQMIFSDQIPADRLAEIAADYPEFWETTGHDPY